MEWSATRFEPEGGRKVRGSIPPFSVLDGEVVRRDHRLLTGRGC